MGRAYWLGSVAKWAWLGFTAAWVTGRVHGLVMTLVVLHGQVGVVRLVPNLCTAYWLVSTVLWVSLQEPLLHKAAGGDPVLGYATGSLPFRAGLCGTVLWLGEVAVRSQHLTTDPSNRASPSAETGSSSQLLADPGRMHCLPMDTASWPSQNPSLC